jgi:hypothetical protein
MQTHDILICRLREREAVAQAEGRHDDSYAFDDAADCIAGLEAENAALKSGHKESERQIGDLYDRIAEMMGESAALRERVSALELAQKPFGPINHPTPCVFCRDPIGHGGMQCPVYPTAFYPTERAKHD